MTPQRSQNFRRYRFCFIFNMVASLRIGSVTLCDANKTHIIFSPDELFIEYSHLGLMKI